jgi:hypothetical protein
LRLSRPAGEATEMTSENLPKRTISGPIVRAGRIFRDPHGQPSIPMVAPRGGRGAETGAPYERYFVIGGRAHVAALIEDVRWRRKRLSDPWSELPAELFEGAVRLSTYDLSPTRVLDASGPAAHRRFRFPANIVGDDGSEAAYRPFQRMVAVLRQDWDHAILIDSAALTDVKTLLLPRAVALTLPPPTSSLKVAIPADVIEHALGRRELPREYDLAL